jgi:hypothetical protein
MKYHGVLTIAYIYQKFHNAHIHELWITRVYITTTKYTIHESNQKYFENTKINLGRLQPWVRACDGEDSTGFRSGEEEKGFVLRMASAWLRRRAVHWRARRARERGELG